MLIETDNTLYLISRRAGYTNVMFAALLTGFDSSLSLCCPYHMQTPGNFITCVFEFGCFGMLSRKVPVY